MDLEKEETFSFAPNIITEVLGRDLTENYSVVLSEQIKNAKDAGASEVVIDFGNFPKKIVIKDDGNGISSLKDTWFIAGTSVKKGNHDMLGGKGIGRFTLFALGKRLKVKTVTEKRIQIFELNSNDLSSVSNVESYRVPISVSPNSEGEESGTEIIITDIIPEIIDTALIRRDLENLVLDSSIKIKIISNEGSQENLIPFEEGIKYSTLRANFTLCSDKNKDLKLKKVVNVGLGDEEELLSNEVSDKLNKFINSDDNINIIKHFGDLSLKVYHFYSPKVPNVSNLYEKVGSLKRSDIRKRFLSYSLGFNIYRNEFKIFGFGSNDWLELENSSRNESSKMSNKQTVGIIELSKESEYILRETTNREGLKKNTRNFLVFKKLILQLIEEINKERKNVGTGLISILKRNAGVNKKEAISDDIDEPQKRFLKSKNDQKNDKKINNEKEMVNKSGNIKDSNKEKGGVGDQASKQHNNEKPKIVFKKKPQKAPINKNIDVTEFVEYGVNGNGERVQSNNLEYICFGEKLANNNLQSQSVPHEIKITIRTADKEATDILNLNIFDPAKGLASRKELFPLTENKYYKFQSEDSNDVTINLIEQINILWIDGKFDYVVSSAMRPLIEIEVRKVITANQSITKGIKIEKVRSGLNGVEDIVNFALEENIRRKILKGMNLSNNEANNLFNLLTYTDDFKKSGSKFKEKLDRTNLGSHDPEHAINPDNLKSLEQNIIVFLNISSALRTILGQ
ncbi:hypothetical protein EGT49_10010 [Companilactobacillus suantsaicola]|uniref:Uncharacterized protein n=1 Tax=Companilactobacillus suantsaicola TaxID=2487723 RepID=A0A4Z0JIQ7_9LACO|nr:ATP-binding protein [Companilactobacillus suantsaicola]TGD21953.1 hypothetical protein EGT49_10010 [Companilactobacillus suantsaicola]